MPKKSKSPGKLAYIRIIEMDRMLRMGKFPSLLELSEEFKVTQRTIERDIETMREYFKAPVLYDRKTRTYRYSDQSYILPSITLSQDEIVSILAIQRTMRLYADTPFDVIMQSAFNKMMSMLPANAVISVDIDNLRKAIVFEQGTPLREYSVQVFEKLFQGIILNQRMEIVYYTPEGNKEHGTQFIDPYHIANWGGDWYLIGNDLRRRVVRNFHLALIREAYMLDIKFEIPDGFNAQEHVLNGYSNLKKAGKEVVRIRVDASASEWVKEKTWNFAQKFEKLEKDGSLVLKMDAPFDKTGKESLKRWILQFGGEIEVVEPAWLRSEIKEMLEKGADLYE